MKGLSQFFITLKEHYPGRFSCFCLAGHNTLSFEQGKNGSLLDLSNLPGKRHDLVFANALAPQNHAEFVSFGEIIDKILFRCKYLLLLDTVPSPISESPAVQKQHPLWHGLPFFSFLFKKRRIAARIIDQEVLTRDDTPSSSDQVLVIVLKGDLHDPIIRIDDYPTGVRPIIDNIEEINAIIQDVDRAEIDYHLGIVPALLDREMMGFLGGLQFMRPVLHGYDHCYPSLSQRLIKADDIYNKQGTVQGFDEFNSTPFAVIRKKLYQGKAILEEVTGDTVCGYIPPCNRGNIKTGRALQQLGFTHYFSEKKILFCKLPCLNSDFYGRSSEYPYNKNPQLVTLHVTWEYDLRHEGDSTSLLTLLNHMTIVQKSRMEQSRILFRRLFHG